MSLRVHFDYDGMAQEAQRECEALREVLARRRREPPDPGGELRWKRENSILYTMYLEQRKNREMFSRRATWGRGKPWEQ